jgi:hypothetical protein
MLYEEKFEDTKEVIKSRQSKDRQYNGQKKKDKTIQWPKEGQTIQWPKEEGQDNTMAKRRRTRQYNGQKKKDRQYNGQKKKKGQKDCKTLHRKLKFKQHEPHEKTGVKSGAPEG